MDIYFPFGVAKQMSCELKILGVKETSAAFVVRVEARVIDEGNEVDVHEESLIVGDTLEFAINFKPSTL